MKKRLGVLRRSASRHHEAIGRVCDDDWALEKRIRNVERVPKNWMNCLGLVLAAPHMIEEWCAVEGGYPTLIKQNFDLYRRRD
jgi:hypothetical protein